MVASKTIVKHESVHHSQNILPSPAALQNNNNQYQKKLKKKPRM